MNRAILFTFLLLSTTLLGQNAVTISNKIATKTVVSPPDYRAASADLAATIKAEDLKKYLTVVASDEFEGRETATEGQQMAANFLAEQVRSYGIPPLKREGVEEGYYQKMPFTKSAWGNVALKVNDEAYRHLRDFYCFRRSNMDQPFFEQKEVVF